MTTSIFSPVSAFGALGYNHPVITAAINAQAQTLIHTSNLFYHQGTTELRSAPDGDHRP